MNLLGQRGEVELGYQVGTAQRANAAPPLTTKALGGASMAAEDPTPVTLYTDKHRVPFLVDAGYAEIFDHYSACTNGNGYVVVSIGKRPQKQRVVKVHQFLFGPAPAGLAWDHINRIKTDNRRSNLRIVTRTMNQMNHGLSKRNRSGVRGVNYVPRYGAWLARIRIAGYQKYLGLFKTLEEATRVRNEAEAAFWRESE